MSNRQERRDVEKWYRKNFNYLTELDTELVEHLIEFGFPEETAMTLTCREKCPYCRNTPLFSVNLLLFSREIADDVSDSRIRKLVGSDIDWYILYFCKQCEIFSAQHLKSKKWTVGSEIKKLGGFCSYSEYRKICQIPKTFHHRGLRR